ncbi:MAG: DUF2892 domain-containing protein [Coriobacteriia bacterium]|nr:DUF2892 domain-containing protein [Coriobacteriia bacterium]
MMAQESGGGRRRPAPNVSGRERILSLVLGGGLTTFALTRRGWPARLLAIPGMLLLARGRSGRSLLYTALDVSTAPRVVEPGEEERPGAEAEEAVPSPPESAPAGVVAHSEPGEEAPRPEVPRTHRHAEPDTELGEPDVRVTPKLMQELSGSPPPP